jgi:hypothetical protein
MQPSKRARPASVEAINHQIGSLVVARHALRVEGAGAAALERNRLRIVRAQWALSHALLDRYHVAKPSEEAA